jgi:N-acetylmuramoyl-L-alanine amidase
MMALLEGRKDAVEPPRSEQDFQISERRPDDLASVKPEKAPIEAPEVHQQEIRQADCRSHGDDHPGPWSRWRRSRSHWQGRQLRKNVTLEVARRLKARIDAEPNMRAVLTRDSDFFVPLQMRVQKARRVQSDLFLSIHADGWIRPDAHGSSVFVLSEKGVQHPGTLARSA